LARQGGGLPAGELFSSNGRLCSFAGKTVYVGEAFRPGYYLPAEGYIPFPANVSIAVENQGGTFICADKTYWFPGDLGDIQNSIATVLPYGAVPGTAFMFPDKSMCGWFGANGVVFGSTSGEVEAVMSDNITVTPPATGTAYVVDDEYRRVVSCGWCVNLQNKAATQYSGYDFTSISGNYGTKDDGIHNLNAAVDVPWSVDFGKINFGSEELKHLPNAYVGVDSGEPMILTVTLPDGTAYDYTARSSGTDLKMQRIDVGKGLRANWFNLSLSNDTGSDFSLASVSFAPTVSTRRI